ncbi:MAG TPA: asparagine synthase (glutamine-hydrolyzing) [Phycisphaerae bacterium]|nr:asparagine synthase (glutamine-hydrolyzing) [Phycisphaerae bacterium]
MCGIAGSLDFRGNPIDEDELRRACAVLGHRGPDDRGTLVAPGEGFSAGLAAVRLAVVDPTPAGHQPMCVGDGRYALAYNGEVYNFRELRAELLRAGWSFRTQTDTEVVAVACAHWGPDALDRFNGMFALAFLDTHTRRGFLARDRFGIKPLLVLRAGDRAHFASEMAAFEAFSGWDRAIDRDALLHYLHFGYFAAPRSIHAGVERVPPGAYIPFDATGLKSATSYAAPAAGEAPDYSHACADLRRALGASVARRRVADVPLGTFLSGGIDSAIIALHLAECTAGPIETFSIGFREHARYDETHYARLMAAELGSRHHELRLSFDDVIAELPSVLDHLGEPFFDSSIVPTAFVSRLARQHVTVCLSGDGGDELFGGYWRYLGHEAAAGYARLPRWLRAGVIDPLLQHSRSSKSTRWSNRVRQVRKLLRGADEAPIRRHLLWSTLIDRGSARILRDPTASAAVFAEAETVFERVTAHLPAGDPLNRILAYDVRAGLPGDMLHKVDLASMRAALEVRVPFLDPEVVALAERCPSTYKLDRGLRKRMLVDAYRGRIPDAILDREKAGFELPIGEFLRDRLRGLFLDTVTRDCVERFDMLDYAGVMAVYDDHCARRGEHADLLFALLSLCWWRRRV